MFLNQTAAHDQFFSLHNTYVCRVWELGIFWYNYIVSISVTLDSFIHLSNTVKLRVERESKLTLNHCLESKSKNLLKNIVANILVYKKFCWKLCNAFNLQTLHQVYYYTSHFFVSFRATLTFSLIEVAAFWPLVDIAPKKGQKKMGS